MQVDQTPNGFVIVRGNSKPSFFSFFVDHDSSCWTTRSFMAQFYRERREAEKDISELRKRATLRRHTAVARLLRQKVQQTKEGASNLPAIAGVIGFEVLTVLIEYVNEK